MTITNITLDPIIMTVLSVSVFGPESVSYERSRLGNRTNLRHVSARVILGKNTPKSVFQYFQIPRFSKWIVLQYFQVPRQSTWIVFQYFQDPRLPIRLKSK